MMTCPREPNPGEKITASWMRELVRYVRSLKPIQGPGMSLERKPDGTVFKSTPGAKARSAANALPWTFSCAVDPDTRERTGGWSNCILQLGYNYWLVSPDVTGLDEVHSGTITGTDETADGAYVVEVNLSQKTAVIKLIEDISHNYPIDEYAHVVYVDIGRVVDGRQSERIPNHPVIYMYA